MTRIPHSRVPACTIVRSTRSGRQPDNRRVLLLASMVCCSLAIALRPVQAAEEALPGAGLARQPTLRATPPDTVRDQALAWLQARPAPPEVLQQAAALWSPQGMLDGRDTLDRLAATLALADERVAALVRTCQRPRPPGPLAPQEWLKHDELDTFARNNLRLYYGRWLVHQHLYDDALEQLQTLEPAAVVDPAALLFYQAVAHHRLLHKEAGLEALTKLLNDVADLPQRYRALAGLMQADLEQLRGDSLDEISRMMDDIRRRLWLGHAGKRVRKQEDDVIAKLDKLIEELERQQQQQQQQQSGGQGSGSRPTQPLRDSRLREYKRPGDVDRRDVGHRTGWGDLPPKERERALQQIGKDFPAHYRDAIEQYFRRLASEGETEP